MNWLFLMLGGVLEMGFTTCMRFIKSPTDIGWIAGLLVCLVASIGSVQIAIRSIPLGTAYAVWTAIGSVGTVILGVLCFNEPVSVLRFAFIGGIVACVIGLKLAGG